MPGRQQMYAVYLSDLAKPADRFICGRATLEGARRAVKKHNAEIVRELGPKAPLYYIRRREDFQ